MDDSHQTFDENFGVVHYLLKNCNLPNMEKLVIEGGLLPCGLQVNDYRSELRQYNLNKITLPNFRSMATYCNLKRIDLIGCNLFYDELKKDDINVFLQMIIPQSPKDIELKLRLNDEITNEIKKSKKPEEIDEMKQNIKNEIDEKYKPKFDENELCSVNSRQNRKYEWNSKIEMLSIVGFDRLALQPLDNPMSDYLISKLNNSERIKHGLSNLQSFQCKNHATLPRDAYPPPDFLPTGTYITGAILNNTANQLTSLHIDNGITCLWNWDFVKNDYPCTKEIILVSCKCATFMLDTKWF